jgi:DNA modification methylase
MCGSGTTLPVAGKLRRRFAGGDVSEVAVRIVEARLRKSELPFESIVVDRG